MSKKQKNTSKQTPKLNKPVQTFRGECVVKMGGQDVTLQYGVPSHRVFTQLTGHTSTSILARLSEDGGLMVDPSFIVPMLACGLVYHEKFATADPQAVQNQVEGYLMRAIEGPEYGGAGLSMHKAIGKYAAPALEAFLKSLGYADIGVAMGNVVAELAKDGSTKTSTGPFNFGEGGDDPLDSEEETGTGTHSDTSSPEADETVTSPTPTTPAPQEEESL